MSVLKTTRPFKEGSRSSPTQTYSSLSLSHLRSFNNNLSPLASEAYTFKTTFFYPRGFDLLFKVLIKKLLLKIRIL